MCPLINVSASSALSLQPQSGALLQNKWPVQMSLKLLSFRMKRTCSNRTLMVIAGDQAKDEHECVRCLYLS